MAFMITVSDDQERRFTVLFEDPAIHPAHWVDANYPDCTFVVVPPVTVTVPIGESIPERKFKDRASS